MHLEVSEIGHWTNIFQVASYSNDPQQPPQPQQTLQMTTTSLQVQVLSVRDQQAKIDRLTSVVAQWLTGKPSRADNANSHNNRHQTTRHHSPNMSFITQNYNRQHMYNDNQGEQRQSSYNRRPQQYSRQETDQRKYSQSSQNIDNINVSVLNALENYPIKQALTQLTLNTLQEYNVSDREDTIPWLGQVELVVERTGIDPLEVGISKLKGLALADISTVHKEEGLSWHKFRQCLIEQYLTVPYVPDALLLYSKKSQWDNGSTTRYLVRNKILLEQIH